MSESYLMIRPEVDYRNEEEKYAVPMIVYSEI